MCKKDDLCVDGNPLTNLNTFEGDNWIATNDNTNSWMTFNTADNRKCKSHEQVAGAPPSWGTTSAPYAFNRATKCCF